MEKITGVLDDGILNKEIRFIKLKRAVEGIGVHKCTHYEDQKKREYGLSKG
jgi:hypothetical protein